MRRVLVAIAAIALTAGAVAWRLHAQPLGLAALARRPPQAFFPAGAPPAPDYASPAAWAAWPGRHSNAELAPAGVTAVDPATAKVDVFFIHPTTYLANEKWNAAFDEPGRALRGVDDGVLANQASVFNSCCRIFAPRYRQATFAAFREESADATGAIDLAYQDVRRAFDYYLAHENNGRPFIIASHSQGSQHALRLLQARIIGTPLQRQLVAAYVIGGFTPVEIEQAGLPICRAARETGCLINWNSVTEAGKAARRQGAQRIWFDGRYESAAGRRIVCVNPLSWEADGSAPASANAGALTPALPGHGALVPGVTGARCEDGLLVVDLAPGMRPRFPDPLAIVGIYHDLDYNLFWLNVRRNAAERADAFLSRQ